MSATPSLNSVRQAIDELDDLSDTQTIRLLERHSPYREGSREANVDEAIRVIKPEDTQSMQAIKSDVKRNAPVLFAVQLDWSVSPFDMAKVPPLAIFNAYTLYTTEANREGRAWYGLRLGFFSDAVSAKQVAYYVRSDFKTVSVVPVTTIEKERATDLNAARSGIYNAANIREVAAPTPQSIATASASGVFQLLEDDTPEHIAQDVDGEMSPRFSKPAPEKAPAPAQAAATPAEPAKAAAPAAKSRKPGPRGAKRDAHARSTRRLSTRRWKFSVPTRSRSPTTAPRHRRAPPARQDRQEGLEVRLADRSPVGQEIVNHRPLERAPGRWARSTHPCRCRRR